MGSNYQQSPDADEPRALDHAERALPIGDRT